MVHPLDRVVASDLSYLVLEERRKNGELHSGLVHGQHERFNTPHMLVTYRRAFRLDANEPSGDDANPYPVRRVGE